MKLNTYYRFCPSKFHTSIARNLAPKLPIIFSSMRWDNINPQKRLCSCKNVDIHFGVNVNRDISSVGWFSCMGRMEWVPFRMILGMVLMKGLMIWMNNFKIHRMFLFRIISISIYIIVSSSADQVSHAMQIKSKHYM